MSSLKFAVVSLALLIGSCGAGPQQPCDETDDCKKGLTCETWSADHDAVAGKCASSKCCATSIVPIVVEKRRREAVAAARAAQCDAFGSAAVPVFQVLMRIVNKGEWVGDDMAKMSKMMTELVAAVEKIELAGDLAELRKEMVARAKDFQSTCDELRVAMDESEDTELVKTKMMVLQKKYEALGVPVMNYNRVCTGVMPGEQPSR